ncbi:MAG: PAS domain-containing protein, partial [Candidatus Firestonebacteria bacterium]|nr:PAS domain-containing protein [Candidatus Firestonebacteria bacterium]
LIIIDINTHRLSHIDEILNSAEKDVVILIKPDKIDKFTLENMPPSVYGYVEIQSIRIDLPIVVEHALEKQRYKNIVSLLKHSKDNVPNLFSHPGINHEMGFNNGNSIYWHGDSEGRETSQFLHKKALVNFAKILTANFDTRELFIHFMDAVMEITRVSKMSVMLRDNEGFKIKAHWGLDPYIADNIRLKDDNALVVWLSQTGRIKNKPLNPMDTVSIDIKSDMDLLQCVFSFPMIYKGKLIGIFNIDSKITEEPFHKEELEIIYGLCNYLAASVKDIDLYHEIWYQKEFAKNILSSMNSGVITIGKDEKITIFNQQASVILNLNTDEIIGRDLRSLPSPLGDILYETMVTGTSYKRYEVDLKSQNVPLGINSYRLIDENQIPVGAGIVFNDLSDSKKLEEQKRKTEKLEAINNLVAQIAHEVRNPMTSICTYTQLLNDKCKEEELINFYTVAVFQSIQKLDNLISKLIIFSNKQEYTLKHEDINIIIDEITGSILKEIPQTYKFIKQNSDKSIFVNIDKKVFSKAISFLILSAVDRTPEGTDIKIGTDTVMIEGAPRAEISIQYNGSEFTNRERLNLRDPLLNIDNLGAELNIPISHKIIEEHNGTLGLKCENGINYFIIKLPIADEIIEAAKSVDMI